MTAIGYVRLSLETDASTSVDRQKIEIRRYCKARGIKLVDILEDVDVSGSKAPDQRPGLKEALSRIESGEAHSLVVWRIDRLARSVVGFSEVAQRVEQAGGALVTISEGIDLGTATGKMVIQVLAVFAEFELNTIRERARHSHQHLRSEGKFSGGATPYGTRSVPHPSGKGHVLEVDPDQAAVIKDMANMARKGLRLSAIARELNKREIPTRTGGKWRHNYVSQVLRRETLMGDEITPRILTPRSWISVQEALDRGPKAPKIDGARIALLRHRIKCGLCGKPLAVATRRKVPQNYACQNLDCQSVAGRAERIDNFVAQRMLYLFGDLDQVKRQAATHDPAQQERSELLGALSDIEDARYLRRELTDERYLELRAGIEDLLAKLPSPEMVEGAITIPTGLTLAEYFEAAEPMLQAEILAEFVDEVILDRAKKSVWNPDRLKIRWTTSAEWDQAPWLEFEP